MIIPQAGAPMIYRVVLRAAKAQSKILCAERQVKSR